ncbi:MAG: hypothetical protein HY553_15940 [Elusimicrobia bacterium]|nr:hypothetical protein [Elusimicrobiota bacterium]
MRLLTVGLAVAVLTLLLAAPAVASCAPRAPITENAARAVAVVYGTVTGTEPGAVIMRVEKVLKGQAATPLRVFVGPGRSAGSGQVVFTSVDYGPAPVGSDHVLYVISGSDGQLETSACIGSHAGPPDPIEVTYFGVGTFAASVAPSPNAPSASAVAATPPPDEVAAAPIGGTETFRTVLVVSALGAGAVAVLVLILRRRLVGAR